MCDCELPEPNVIGECRACRRLVLSQVHTALTAHVDAHLDAASQQRLLSAFTWHWKDRISGRCWNGTHTRCTGRMAVPAGRDNTVITRCECPECRHPTIPESEVPWSTTTESQ